MINLSTYLKLVIACTDYTCIHSQCVTGKYSTFSLTFKAEVLNTMLLGICERFVHVWNEKNYIPRPFVFYRACGRTLICLEVRQYFVPINILEGGYYGRQPLTKQYNSQLPWFYSFYFQCELLDMCLKVKQKAIQHNKSGVLWYCFDMQQRQQKSQLGVFMLTANTTINKRPMGLDAMMACHKRSSSYLSLMQTVSTAIQCNLLQENLTLIHKNQKWGPTDAIIEH